MKKSIRIILCSVFALLLTAWIISKHHLIGSFDPDRYYHLAVSKIYAEQGTPKTLDAVEGLGWDQFFAEKEFFFHKLTQVGYQMGGDRGVLRVGSVLTGLLFFLVFVFAYQIFPSYWTPLIWGISLLGASRFVMRMNYLRPHVLGILLLVCMVAALLRRKPKVLFALSFLFALSYHAVYLPIMLIGLYFFSLYVTEAKFSKWPMVGVLGLSMGILVNPFFPQNLLMGIRHLWIALFEMQSLALDFGNELIPLRSDQFFNEILWLFILIGLGFSIWFFKPQFKNTGFTFLLFCTGVFTTLGGLSPRSLEIAVPIAILFAVHVFAVFPKKWIALGTMAVAAFTQKASYMSVFFPLPVDASSLTALTNGLRDLNLPAQSRVYNCEWDMTPYLLYANSKVKFIDLLDPSFLWVHNKDLATSRFELRAGTVLDPYGLVKQSFQAQYVFCRNDVVNQQLDLDPRFKRLYPKPEVKTGGASLYELNPEEPDQFVQKISVSFLNTLDSADPNLDYLKIFPETPRDFKNFEESRAYQKGLFYDFMPYFKRAFADTPKEKLEKGAFCAVIKVGSQEIKKHIGSEYLGLGGGRNLRIWVNRKKFYNSLVPSELPKLFVNLVKLDHPLRASDQVEAVVCSGTQASYLALALSFWTPLQLKKVCEYKGFQMPRHLEERSHWQYSGFSEVTCLGTFAQSSNR